MKRKSKGLLTIGYEQAAAPAVLEELQQAGTQVLVDVRAVAASRRPGFSKRQLAASLDEARIRYLHLRGLGTPAEGRQAARAGRFDDLFQIYEAHLATPQAREEMDELLALAQSGQRLCLLCYERDATHCHRRRIAEIVCEETGVEVQHLAVPLAS